MRAQARKTNGVGDAMPRKSSNPPFLTFEGLVEAVGKYCAKNDIAVDSGAIKAIVTGTFDTLFLRITSDKRLAGDHFTSRLFKMIVKDRVERLHRNPKLGKAVAKGASRVVVFKMASELHQKLEEKFRKKASQKLKEAEAIKNGEVPPKVAEEPKKLLKKKKKLHKSSSSSEE
jgi:nucleoid DNA-binding protein